MAARTKKVNLDERHKNSIKASQLLNRLHRMGLGELGPNGMTSNQLKAADIFLAKTMPDLRATQVSGDADNPIVHRVIVTGVRRAGDLPRQGVSLPLDRPQLELEAIERPTSKDH